MLNGLKKVADRLISLSALVGSVGLVVEVAVILVDVIGRYFGSPLKGAQDISQMTMVIIVFGGMALCDKLGGHIAVDIFENVFPDWLNRLSDFLSATIGALIFGGIAWTIYTSSKLSLMLHLATNVIYLPKAYFQWAMCVFAAITAFAMILRAISLATAKHHVHVEEHSL